MCKNCGWHQPTNGNSVDSMALVSKFRFGSRKNLFTAWINGVVLSFAVVLALTMHCLCCAVLMKRVSAWQSFGWQDQIFEAGLMDLKKAYPTANKGPFWYLLQHHGICGWTFLEFAARVSLSPWILHKDWTRHFPSFPECALQTCPWFWRRWWHKPLGLE